MSFQMQETMFLILSDKSMLYAQLSLLVRSFSGDNCAKFLYTYFTIYVEFLNLDLLVVDYINQSCILRLEDMFKL